jgi:hypothetical protein
MTQQVPTRIAPSRNGDGFVLTLWGDWPISAGVDALRDAARVGARHVSVIVELEQRGALDHDVHFRGVLDVASARDFAASRQLARLRTMAVVASELHLELSCLPIVFARGLHDRQWVRPRHPRSWFDA